MPDSRWPRVDELFHRALEIPEAGRGAFLAEACGGDRELRGRVETLLRSDSRAGVFLETPAINVVTGPSAPPAGEPERVEGRLIGRYRLVRLIGSGGMGSVYLGERHDGQFTQRVAVKLIKRGMDTDEIVHRFRAERQTLANLGHPHICRLLDGGVADDGRPFLVMEHIEGERIDEYCDRRRLDVGRRLELFRAVCGGVQYAHQNLVVHRDLKPGNILVTPDGGPKLLDFGIAKVLRRDGDEDATEATLGGSRPLTPRYASPEQAAGGPITTASDVYSLGVILYELLTGRSPFPDAPAVPGTPGSRLRSAGAERPSTAITHPPAEPPLGDEEPPLSESPAAARGTTPGRLRRLLRGDLDTITLTALRHEPERRYASAQQLGDDIRRHLEGLPVLARPDTLRYRAGKFIRRHRVLVGGLAALVVILGAAAAVSTVSAVSAIRARDDARAEASKANEVIRFLDDMLASANPSSGRARDTTVREVLDEASGRVQRELSGLPAVAATIRLTIGNTYRNLGLYEEAEGHVRSCLDARRELLGPGHPDAVAAMFGYARLLRVMQRLPEAERALLEALDLTRALPDHGGALLPEVLNEAGQLRETQGRYRDADAFYTEGLKVARRVLRPDHTATMSLLHNLGWNAFARGDSAAAERLLRETLEARRRVFGERHSGTATTMNNLGVVLRDRGVLDEAERLLVRSIELQREMLGEEDRRTLSSMSNLAKVYTRQKRLEEAEELTRRVLEAQRRLFGPTHRTTVYSIHSLAGILKTRGKMDEAEERYREAAAQGREAFGPTHTDFLECQEDLGLLLAERGKTGEAEPLLRATLETARATLDPGHWRGARYAGSLGSCLALSGRYEEAEPLLLEAYAAQRAALGEADRRTRAARSRLAEFYERWGRPDKADEFRAPPPPPANAADASRSPTPEPPAGR